MNFIQVLRKFIAPKKTFQKIPFTCWDFACFGQVKSIKKMILLSFFFDMNFVKGINYKLILMNTLTRFFHQVIKLIQISWTPTVRRVQA